MQLFNAISNTRVMNKHGLKIAWSVSALCLIWLILSIAFHVRSQAILKSSNYQQQTLPPITQDAGKMYRAKDIVGANLFGNPNPKPVVKVAPPTTLDLTLQGILWASDDSLARAIIMSGRKNSKLYSVGERIDGAGASIKEIRGNEVLLDRNGAVESLPLIKKTTSGNRQIISFSNTNPIPLDLGNTVSRATPSKPDTIQRSTPKPNSPNGEPRKIRKPNFSGLDRALKKMGEL